VSGGKIKPGLLDAIAFVKGDKSKGKLTLYRVNKRQPTKDLFSGFPCREKWAANRGTVDYLADKLATVTQERDQLRAALQRLVDAKDEKDANGDTPRYRELKAGAWEEAREVLAKTKPHDP
jgi:hypothetical protein